jgi:hypothetical protein
MVTFMNIIYESMVLEVENLMYFEWRRARPPPRTGDDIAMKALFL